MGAGVLDSVPHVCIARAFTTKQYPIPETLASLGFLNLHLGEESRQNQVGDVIYPFPKVC